MIVSWEQQRINDVAWYKAMVNKNIALHLNCDYFTLLYKNYCKSLHGKVFRNVVDIGISNTGGFLAIMPNKITYRVGFDPAVGMLKKTNMLPLAFHIHYKEGFAESMKFPTGSYDLVIITNAIDHVKDMEQSVKEIKRILKPEGYLLFNTYLRVKKPHPFTFETWREARKLWEGFSIIEHYEIKDNHPYDRRSDCYHAIMQLKKPIKDIPIKYENICD